MKIPNNFLTCSMHIPDFPFHVIADWYTDHGRHSLPWRTNQTPYSVWISEIFLQQTQVSRGEKYFFSVIADFPTLEDFAKLSYEQFFPYYDGLGYYSRAKNMLKTAKIIVEKYNGKFPNTFQELVQLPGIGPYTAQAILAFGYDYPVLAFDVNIKKIFSRFYLWSRQKPLSREMQHTLQKQFEKSKISGRQINAALMDFASLVDKNNTQHIDWTNYPLKNSIFYQEKWLSEEKWAKPHTNFNRTSARIFVFLHENHKKYFSTHPDKFQPVSLSPTSEDHRHAIKKYFIQNFSIAVSVRPPFLKKQHAWETYFCYHAQIQKWDETDFWEFQKEAYCQFLDDFFK